MKEDEEQGPEKGTTRKARKAPSKDRLVVRRKPRMNTILGTVFCVVGGALVALSALAGNWVEPALAGSQSGGQTLTGFDLFAQGGIYYLTMLVPLGALLAIIMAIVVLFRQSRTRDLSGTFPMGTLAFSLVSAVGLLLIIIHLNSDFILTAPNTKYGPAVFLATFGMVVMTAGGMVLTVDLLERRRRAGRFATSGGSKDLAAVLRPSGKSSKQKADRGEGRAGPGDDMLESDGNGNSGGSYKDAGSSCPSCHSPTLPDWRICPICGEELV
jgi:hypothetical protein